MNRMEHVIEHYESIDEHSRLSKGLGLLELIRVRHILNAYLPTSPAVIADVGGATGTHSFWLTEMGHEVHLCDVVPSHIRRAEYEEKRRGVSLASKVACDARALPYDDDFCEAMLLFGPMYHLLERSERTVALAEAKRVLKRDGLLFVAGITPLASTIVGIERGWVFDDDYMTMCREEIETSRHRRPTTWPKLFADAYFHEPNALADEIAEAGFAVDRVVGLEGLAWLAPDFDDAMADDKKRETLVELAGLMEANPAMSPHVLAVAKVGT